MDRATHYKNIYQTKSDAYDFLISKEDYQGNLLKTLKAIAPIDGSTILEIGAGTGRFTAMLAPHAKAITALDEAAPMLEVAKMKLARMGFQNCDLQIAHNQSLPVKDQYADICLAGWTLGHLRQWYPDSWKGELELALSEMKRCCKPGGHVIIIETLGTATEVPQVVKPDVLEFYSTLENTHGFRRTVIRTDFRFDSQSEAEQICRFFFGAEIADTVMRSETSIVPECTGIWYRVL